MKKLLAVLVIVGVLAAFGGALVVSADTPDQPYGYGRGFGHMGRGFGYLPQGEPGVMHEIMEEAMAASLGLTVEELEARHEAGETYWDIARAQFPGITDEEILDKMAQARDNALQAAVEQGLITQDQADWMGQGGMGRFGYDSDDGSTFRRGGRFGGWGCPGMAAPQQFSPRGGNWSYQSS